MKQRQMQQSGGPVGMPGSQGGPGSLGSTGPLGTNQQQQQNGGPNNGQMNTTTHGQAGSVTSMAAGGGLMPPRTNLGGGLMGNLQPPNQLPAAILATEEPTELEPKPAVDSNMLANQLSTGLKQASAVGQAASGGPQGPQQPPPLAPGPSPMAIPAPSSAPQPAPPLPDSTSDRFHAAGATPNPLALSGSTVGGTPSQFLSAQHGSEAPSSSLGSSVSKYKRPDHH